MEKLKKELTNDLLNLFDEIKKNVKVNGKPYVPTRYLQAISKSDSLEAARKLVSNTNPDEGLITLQGDDKLYFSLEALILRNPKYHDLFGKDILAMARKKLKSLNYHEEGLGL